ncbi:MAG: ATP-binding protein [Phycisphaerales bacterium]
MGDHTNNNSTVVELRDRRDEIEAVEHRILAELDRFGYPPSSGFAVRLALEEAITNAFEHGHATLPDESVTVEFAVRPERVRISIEDRGPGFDPGAIPDPTLDENLDKPHGRGLMLIRSFMTEVRHNGSGNRLIMVYERPTGPEAG